MKTLKKGVYTLLITPFRQDFSLDEEGLRKLVRMQVESPVAGIAPLGVTGENTLLTEKEISRVVEIIVEEAAGRKLVLPDICLMDTKGSIERAKLYASLGADFVVAFTPYLILPSSEGLVTYYTELADASPIPVILHSSKSRTGVELSPEQSARLARHPNIVAIKDGKKELDHLAKLLYLTRNDDFLVFTGKDTTAFPTVAMGGAGSFSVAGNVVPDIMGEMVNRALEGDLEGAKELHLQYYRLFEALRFESNPMAAKKALELMGVIHGGLRPPLTPLSEGKTAILRGILEEKGLI